jgi:lactate dehydrogenase-like 2-hydroxyacid dehydrogenase
MRERTAFDAKLLDALRLLVTTGAANASIDVAAAQARGVAVCGTRSLASPTAELTWGLVLAVARQLPDGDSGMRSGGWQTTIGTELAGVLAWSPNLDPEVVRGLGVVPTSKDELLVRSDVVSLHLRLSKRTRGVIGSRSCTDQAVGVPREHLAGPARRRAAASGPPAAQHPEERAHPTPRVRHRGWLRGLRRQRRRGHPRWLVGEPMRVIHPEG